MAAMVAVAGLTGARPPREVRAAGVLGAASPLVFGQRAVGIDLALEAGEERLPRLLRRLARVVGGVQAVRPDPATQRHVGRVEGPGHGRRRDRYDRRWRMRSFGVGIDAASFTRRQRKGKLFHSLAISTGTAVPRREAGARPSKSKCGAAVARPGTVRRKELAPVWGADAASLDRHGGDGEAQGSETALLLCGAAGWPRMRVNRASGVPQPWGTELRELRQLPHWRRLPDSRRVLAA